ncbi:hypothetical protein BOX15_Mlig021034g5, partial [Macrostomum lignano]
PSAVTVAATAPQCVAAEASHSSESQVEVNTLVELTDCNLNLEASQGRSQQANKQRFKQARAPPPAKQQAEACQSLNFRNPVTARYPNTDQLWHRVGELSLFDWSVSGNETCIVVRGRGFCIALDVGVCPPQAVDADHVFISHGHVDHCGALHMHIRKRQLLRLPPAVYYMPECLINPMQSTLAAFVTMQGDSDYAEMVSNSRLVGLKVGDRVPISNDNNQPADAASLTLSVFATDHRVPSLGCILRRRHIVLLPECRRLSQDELRARVAQGLPVRGPEWEPLLGYTGDTRFNVFLTPQDPDLLRVRLLISELTFLSGSIERADSFGHCHVDQFAQHWRLFGAVNRLVFVHFSNKVLPEEILERVYSTLPQQLGRRVYCGLIAKRLLYS